MSLDGFVAQQYLAAGLIDEMLISVVPLLLRDAKAPPLHKTARFRRI